MQPISDLTDKTGKALRTATQNSTTTSPESSSESWEGLATPYILGLFGQFRMAYGNVWRSQFQDEAATEKAMRAWARTLRHVNPKQLKRGLDALPAMPPTAPLFRDLCGAGPTHNTAAYRAFPPALPKPKARQEIVQAELAKMRERKPMTPDEIDAARAALRGGM